MDNFVKCIESIAHLISASAWPLVVLLFGFRFGPSFMRVVAEAGKIGLKAGSAEVTIEARESALAAVGAAEAARTMQNGVVVPPPSAQEIVSSVREVTSPRYLRRLKDAHILWVDDKPLNNFFERKAFEAVGLKIETASSTAEALEKIQMQEFDLIISDMQRPPDLTAGLTLLESVKDKDYPVIIFTNSNDEKLREQAKKLGASAYIVTATNLFQTVLKMISNRKVSFETANLKL